MRIIAVCSEMALTGFANNHFIFYLTVALLLERYVYSTAGLCTMKFMLVYVRLKRFLHFNLRT